MNITIDEALNNYMNYVILKDKPQSIRSIKSRINNFIRPYFKNINVSDLTKKDYLLWQSEIESKGYKYRYKRAIHNTFVSFLNYCVKYYDLNENIASKVGNFTKTEPIRKFNIWNYSTFRKFIKVVNEIVYKVFFNFLFFTGCRTGEAQALQFKHIEYGIAHIRQTISKEYINGERAITTPKTESSIRDIKLDFKMQFEIFILKLYYKKNYGYFNDDFFVFGGTKPLSPTTIDRKFKKWCKIAKVKKIRIHDFRHSHATMLLSKGIPITVISARLGHSDISMTLNVYSHVLEEQEKRVIKTLNLMRLI